MRTKGVRRTRVQAQWQIAISLDEMALCSFSTTSYRAGVQINARPTLEGRDVRV